MGEDVEALISRIRYQTFTPAITTMGACPSCGGRSRGASTCAKCLGQQLEMLCGDGSGLRYVDSMLRARDAEIAVYAVAGGEDG